MTNISSPCMVRVCIYKTWPPSSLASKVDDFRCRIKWSICTQRMHSQTSVSINILWKRSIPKGTQHNAFLQRVILWSQKSITVIECWRLRSPRSCDFFKLCGRALLVRALASVHLLGCFMGFPNSPRQSDDPQWHCWFVPNCINLEIIHQHSIAEESIFISRCKNMH